MLILDVGRLLGAVLLLPFKLVLLLSNQHLFSGEKFIRHRINDLGASTTVSVQPAIVD